MRVLLVSRWVWLVMPGLWLGSAVSSRGHGDLHERIVAVGKEIAKQPRNADLYLRRGELQRAHQEWDAAQADYDRALILDPGLTIIDLARGKMFLEAGWPRSAVVCLDRFLVRKPGHVAALTARARALKELGEGDRSARDYTAAIQASKEPGPELFIERAEVISAMGGERWKEALAGLDEGIERLGSLVTLQLHAIDLEVRMGEVDRGLVRLERVAAQSPRKETWLARRGEILRDAGRGEEAREAFEASLRAIESLPPSRGRVPAMQELKKRVGLSLEQLGEKEE